MPLQDNVRVDIVAYRLEKAKKTLQEAKDVSAIGYWNLAANRLYYSAYYASAALLISHNILSSTHKGVVRMIGQEFVNKNILSIEDSKLLGRLFTMRQSGDYEDLFDWDEEDINPMIPKVEEYIERISNIIGGCY